MRTRIFALIVAIFLPAMGATAEDPALATLTDADKETQALVAKVVAGYGGETALSRIETIRAVSLIVQKDNGSSYRMAIEALSSFPERFFARISTSQGSMSLAINAQDAYLIPAKAAVPGAAIRLTQNERDDLIRYFNSDPLFVIKNRRSSHYFFAAGTSEKVGSTDCQRLHVFADGLSSDWLVDQATGRVVRTVIGDLQNDFDEWKAVGQSSVPFKVKTTSKGVVVSEMAYAAYELNPSIEIDPIFRKPDLWLMRWKVQPRAGGSAYSPGTSSSSSGQSEQSKSSAATYRPPVVAPTDSSVVIWDSGASPFE